MQHGSATDMLQRMREMIGLRTFNEGLFKQLFLSKLPQQVQAVLVSFQNNALDELAASADRILEITKSSTTEVFSVKEKPQSTQNDKTELCHTLTRHQYIVDFPTRLDAHLDFVFIIDVGIYVTRKRAPLSNSDHCIIHVLPKGYGKSTHQTEKVKSRNYSEENIRNLKNMFHTTNWELFTDDSLENTTDVIIRYLKVCFDICCPTETIFVSFDRLTSSQLKRLRRVKERMYKEKNSNEVRKLNGLINLEIGRLNCMSTQKLLSCKNFPSMWKLFKNPTGDRQFKSDNQLNVCDFKRSFVRQSSDVMLPLSTSLKNSCVPSFTETDVRRCLQLHNSSRCLGPHGISNLLSKKIS
ncbi:unnamed protein product [Schistosoma margrebowiei]|uniref:Uncharacterized protein n=1 Tax=Schistosoma margrebowiei TaxID=48269 RepID=A0A3P8EVF3_9TREM|nr:unnamed protein product [Schistosoma margrebowiei]